MCCIYTIVLEIMAGGFTSFSITTRGRADVKAAGEEPPKWMAYIERNRRKNKTWSITARQHVESEEDLLCNSVLGEATTTTTTALFHDFSCHRQNRPPYYVVLTVGKSGMEWVHWVRAKNLPPGRARATWSAGSAETARSTTQFFE